MENQPQEEFSPAQQRILKLLKFASYLAVFVAMMWVMHGPQ